MTQRRCRHGLPGRPPDGSLVCLSAARVTVVTVAGAVVQPTQCATARGWRAGGAWRMRGVGEKVPDGWRALLDSNQRCGLPRGGLTARCLRPLGQGHIVWRRGARPALPHWCPGRDSNPQSPYGHCILSAACLPDSTTRAGVVLLHWCLRRESNPHAVTGTTTSRLRVCPFRHEGLVHRMLVIAVSLYRVAAMWCPPWESNPHALRRRILSTVRLPIPPCGPCLPVIRQRCPVLPASPA